MIHRSEIYLIDLSNNIGSEQGGLRPAIIVQNDIGNEYSPTTLICPITTKQKKMAATHVELTTEDATIIKDSTVLCEQARVIDKSRIKKKLGEIRSTEKINDINRKIMLSFGITI